jgi:hypothetical protein
MISSKYLHNMVGFIPPFWVGYPSESRENLYISKSHHGMKSPFFREDSHRKNHMKSLMGNPRQLRHEVRGIYGLGGFLSISKELLVLPLVAKNLACMAGLTQKMGDFTNQNSGKSGYKILQYMGIFLTHLFGNILEIFGKYLKLTGNTDLNSIFKVAHGPSEDHYKVKVDRNLGVLSSDKVLLFTSI